MSKSAKKIIRDIAPYVSYAVYSGVHTNPFPAESKHYKAFHKHLARAIWIDAEFEQMCNDMGDDTSTWQKRAYHKPVEPSGELLE